ncbi:hypothetical protein [Eubacterium sp.]|uniref:hypothetical protein n=1 Tax=Eubacterium sp. TaxID=142586 RepID=UPI0035218EBA
MEFSDDFYVKQGYVCYFDKYEKVYNDLDAVFKGFLDGKKYNNFYVPAMIDGDVLQKCGYFESFPDQISAVACVKDDSIEEIMSGKELDTTRVELRNKYLTPSACLHIYPMLCGKKIVDNEIITTKARVYRCEKSGFEELTRLWDFSVREIVFVGTEEFVKENLEDMKNKAFKMAKKISSDVMLEVAHDPFYKGHRNQIKAMLQTKNEQKYELRIPIGDRDVSVASFNFHGHHFSVPFNFDDERKIVSGCVGFGIERWVAACKEYSKLDIESL